MTPVVLPLAELRLVDLHHDTGATDLLADLLADLLELVSDRLPEHLQEVCYGGWSVPGVAEILNLLGLGADAPQPTNLKDLRYTELAPREDGVLEVRHRLRALPAAEAVSGDDHRSWASLFDARVCLRQHPIDEEVVDTPLFIT